MADEYWIILDTPRWKFFPWFFRVKDHFGKVCEYEYAREMYERMQAEISKGESIRLGVTRGKDIYLL